MWKPELWKFAAQWIGWLVAKGNHERAISLARRYVLLLPRDPYGWIQLKLLLEDFVDDPERLQQETVLREGLAKIPGNVDLELVLANLLAQRCEEDGDIDKGREALLIFEKHHHLNPAAPRPLRGLALMASIQGEDEAAVAYAESALVGTTMASDLGPDTFWSLIWILLGVEGGRAKALEWLKSEAERNPNRFDLLLVQSLMLEAEDPTAAATLRSAGKELWFSSPAQLNQWIEGKRQQIRQSENPVRRQL